METPIQGTQTTSKTKSSIVDFCWQLKKDGYKDKTISIYSRHLGMLVKLGADLFDGESVKSVIAVHPTWLNSTKSNVVAAYSKFVSHYKIVWRPPRYTVVNKVPFTPLESEIDSLIAFCGKKISTILQLLKETGIRIGEALSLEWKDIDLESRVVLLNNPEKKGTARTFKISEKLCSMILRLNRTDELVFGKGSKHSVICNFRHQRKRAVVALANPRFEQIHFHTIRHWKATTEYQKTKDILFVMRMLGHKSINNTLIYTHLVDFERSDQYHSAVAKTIEEARKLIESGFEYITEIEKVKLFRKRK